ncbi:hypothetical protein AVEN_246395-1 [Araneus ventricosus]|uniref:Uncharacterized protein n=1 Tax=Araneus ventricosus TaxID=182803 RepID=A0A4Y2RVU2_ARAVE|nr:hypothetical protein AVEN_246395-1 [Araneus ventricosus]
MTSRINDCSNANFYHVLQFILVIELTLVGVNEDSEIDLHSCKKMCDLEQVDSWSTPASKIMGALDSKSLYMARKNVGLRVERRHHLQIFGLQDVVLVDQTNENSLGLCLGCTVDAVALTNQTFNLFGPLKQHLGGKHFAGDDDVQHEVLLWMRQQPKEFYAARIGDLIMR